MTDKPDRIDEILEEIFGFCDPEKCKQTEVCSDCKNKKIKQAREELAKEVFELAIDIPNHTTGYEQMDITRKSIIDLLKGGK